MGYSFYNAMVKRKTDNALRYLGLESDAERIRETGYLAGK
jgi:hypothetical protein